MCDYSLMGMPNRLARDGDDLLSYRFPTGSVGLVEAKTFQPPATPQGCTSFWSRLKLLLQGTEACQPLVVCVPPGARLLLGDIPQKVQSSLKVGPTEEVTFTQLTASANSFRDAVRFKNGAELLVQCLNENQRITVLQVEPVTETRTMSASPQVSTQTGWQI